MKRYFLIFFNLMFGLLSFRSQAQTKTIDSLQHLIRIAGTNEEKLPAILKLCELTLNADSSLPYVVMAEKVAAETKVELNSDKAAYQRAYYYARKNYIDSSLHIIDQLIAKYKKDNDQQKLYLDLLFFRSKILDRGNRYTQSLRQLYEVVETAGIQKDTLVQIQARTGIGWVLMEMEQYKEALRWLYQALNTSADKKFYKNYGALYSNIASTYNSLGNTDSAQAYINIAIKDARENENLLFLSTALSMQAKIFIDGKHPKLAEAPLHEAVEIRKKLNDPFYTVYDMASLASYYANNGQPAKGIALCKEGISMAKESGLSSQLLMIYHALAQNYKAAGDMDQYGKTLESIITLKDSFNNINSSKLLADMQLSSETMKNEKTIAEQKLSLTKKNYWLVGSALFAILAGIIVWLSFRNFKRNQSMRMQVALEEEKRIAAQSIINAEEQERKRIAADLHDNIGAYATAIRTDVEKIVDSGFEKNNALHNLQQHSQEIINSLRDTIWVLNKDHITITGISDRIKNYISKLRPTYEGIQFNISEDIKNDIRISSQHALNIFRIVQEAIHNAIKHADAANISILIASNDSMQIKICDDGKGIAVGENIDGNGVLNMKARARETGLEISFLSGADEGTTLLLKNNTN